MQLTEYTDKQVEKLLKDYIIKKFMYGSKAVLEDDLLLVEEGIITSLGILTLINFIGEQFDISVASEEIVLNNFKNVNSIKSLVLSKIQASSQQTIIKESTERKLLSVVPVKPSGCKRPFFYVHGLVGYGSDPTLAQYIDSNRPFYGLQAIGLDGQKPPYTRIEDMVAHYIREIQTIQPQGPYLLGGRCLGGHIAFAMAQEFRKCNQQVLLVVMADSPKPLIKEEERVQGWNLWISEGKQNLRQKLTNNGLSHCQIQKILAVAQANFQAIVNHVPQLYPGKVVYFAAQENQEYLKEGGNGFDPLQENGWNRWVKGGIEIIKLPGNHKTYYTEPHVKVFAEKLNSCLEEVDDVLFREPW